MLKNFWLHRVVVPFLIGVSLGMLMTFLNVPFMSTVLWIVIVGGSLVHTVILNREIMNVKLFD